MSIRGRSFAGAFAIAEQADIDTPNDTPEAWIPVTNAGLQMSRPNISRGGIYSHPDYQCHQPGLETNSGPIQLEADGIALGQLLRYMFGNPTSAAVGGTIASAAGATGGTAGTMPDGDFSYRVANVFTNTETGEVWEAAAAAASSVVTLSGGGNGSVALTWSNATAPAGNTLTGVRIFRKQDTGAMLGLHYIADDETEAWTDTGALTPSTDIPAEQAYNHTFTPPVDVDELSLLVFTALQQMDLTSALQFRGCKMSQMTMTVAEDGNSPVTFAFDILGRDSIKVDNESPAFTPVCAMLSHQSRVKIDDVQAAVAKAMTLTVNNNVSSVYSLDGNPYPRNHNEGMREIGGQLTLGFENYDQWDRIKNGTEFELYNEIKGTPTTEGAAFRIDANTVATAYRYGASFHMPKCLYDGAGGGQLSGGDLMNEQPNYKARFSSADGYAIRAVVTNRTASYS